MSPIFSMEIIPATIAVISGVIIAFVEKPTLKYCCILLVAAGFFYVGGMAVDHLTDHIVSGSDINKYIRAYYWVMAFLIASVIVFLRWLFKKTEK